MYSIELTYRRWGFRRRVKATFPECWSELNARQFAALFARPDDVRLLSVMLGVGRRIVRRLDLMQIYELAGLFDFMKRDVKASGFKLECLRCPGAGILYAPKAKLAEMTFEQFIYADSYYMQYAEGSREGLYDLVAFLYSPEGGYDKKRAERNAGRLKRVALPVLEAIALNYGLVRKWVAERYPLVFPVEGKKGSGSWPDVFDHIVGDDLKDRGKYAELPVNAVFKFITRKIKEARNHGTKLQGHR